MKILEDLTDPELVALTDEQVAHYCKLHAAEEGTAFPGPEPLTFAEQKPSQDVVVYTVCGAKFTDRTVAEEMQQWLLDHQSDMVETDSNWQVGTYAYFVKGFDGTLEISESTVYSAERYDTLRADIQGFSERKKVAEDATRAWGEAERAYKRVIEWVYEHVRAGRDRESKKTWNQERFDEYLALAENDGQRAWDFFVKAKLQLGCGWRPEGAPVEELAVEETG